MRLKLHRRKASDTTTTRAEAEDPASLRGRVRSVLVIVGAVPAFMVILAAAAFGVDRFLYRGEVLRNVAVAGQSLAGMTDDQARAEIGHIEEGFAAREITFIVNGTEFQLHPGDIGFDIDDDTIIDKAMTYGRGGGVITQFGKWWSRFSDSNELDLPMSIDPMLLNDTLIAWERQAITELPFEGDVELVGTTFRGDHPTSGLAIDRDAAAQIMFDVVTSGSGGSTELPLVVVEPRTTAADIDGFVAQGNALLAGPVVLASDDPDVAITFEPEHLAAAATYAFAVGEDGPRFDLAFDEQVVAQLVEPARATLEIPPVDAQFVVNPDDTVDMVPGRSGTLVDPTAVTDALWTAAHTPQRVGEFPFVEGAEPDFTTAEAEAMMPIELLPSGPTEGTTHHRCCQDRVTNIHLIADIVDGAVVWPGDEFSVNKYVGRRTAERGFLPAGTIVAGELEDTVGGGVSQFATTFYQPVFWGGFEDIVHKPHSFYFSRYPEGIEATISWPTPNLVFKNNTDAVVIIKTEYTDTSIRVKFFGNISGREVEGIVSSRFAWRDPQPKYEPDPTVPPGTEVMDDDGSRGWSVNVTRNVSHPDGRVDSREWTVTYRAWPIVILVHPCNLPEDHDEYDENAVCPVVIPSFVGMSFVDAQGLAASLGLTVTPGDPIEVTAESGLDGLIAAQDIEEGAFVDEGTSVVVRVGFVAPDEGGGGGGG